MNTEYRALNCCNKKSSVRNVCSIRCSFSVSEMCHMVSGGNSVCSYNSREDEGRERIPHTWASSDENYLKSILNSYCLIILRTTPHWSVRMTSCNFRLLTWKQKIKRTYAAWVGTNNKFQIMRHGDSLSSFILSCTITSHKT